MRLSETIRWLGQGGQLLYTDPMKHMLPILVLFSATLAAPGLADYNLKGKIIDCYCTDTQGGRVEVGDSICLHVDGRSFVAQCQMSLNVPMWREIEPSCLSSALRLPLVGGQSLDPALDPSAVNTQVLAPKS